MLIRPRAQIRDLTSSGLYGAATVEDLAALKALVSRPESVLVKTGQAAGVWQWVLASATTADDVFVVTPTSGTAGRYKRVYDKELDLIWSGASRTNSATVTAQFGALLDGGAGRQVYVPDGQYRFDTAVSRTAPVYVRGDGQGAAAGATTNDDTTLIVVNSATGFFFHANTPYGSTFEDMQIASAAGVRPMTAGGGIKLTATAAGIDTAGLSRLKNLSLVSLWNGIEVEKPTYPIFDGIYAQQNLNHDIHLTTTSGVEGSGGFINNAYFASFDAGAAGVAAVYSEVGYLSASNFLMLGKDYGVHFKPTNNPAASVQLIGGHIEEQDIAAVLAEKGDALGGMLQFIGGEYSNIEHGDASFLGTHVLKSNGGGAWLSNVQAIGNVVRNTMSTTNPFFDIQTGDAVTYAFNHLEGVGSNTGLGFKVGSQATKVALYENRIWGTMGTKYTVTTETLLWDHINNLAYADVSSLVPRPGSHVWLSDGLAGSNPLAGSGSGTFASYIGGWVADPALKAANVWTAANTFSISGGAAAVYDDVVWNNSSSYGTGTFHGQKYISNLSTLIGRFGFDFDGTNSGFVIRDVYASGVGSTVVLRVDGTGFIEGKEQTAPSVAASNGYRIFAQDNGAGKTQLMVIFASGAAQQLAIQP